MATLVERLQRDSLDPSVPVSALLRQVKLIAAKLKLGDVEDWVNKELGGYGSNDDPPLYRTVTGSPRVYNPVRRDWMPIVIPGAPKKLAAISKRSIGQKVSELEDLMRGDADSTLQIPVPPHLVDQLNEGMDIQFGDMALLVGRGTVAGILDSVRNRILDWALELEKLDIKGSDASFSIKEQHRAHEPHVTMHIGTIGSFVGNLGVANTAGDIVAQSISVDHVKNVVSQARGHQSELIAAGVDHTTLEDRLAKLEVQLSSSRPDQGLIRTLLVELRSAVIKATGNVVATGLVALVNMALGTGVPSP
jgi:hypothetical protein